MDTQRLALRGTGTPMTARPSQAILLRGFFVTCSASATLMGQAISAQEAAQDAIAEDIIQLEPIVVYGHQETYFENHNTTALKGQASDSETPFLVSSTNETLIKDLNARNLEDVFAYTTGVVRSGYNADAFTIRGFDIDLNNIKVDGLSGITTRFGSPSTANIERVEVLKGPASVLYGNMETGGVVNLVTKKPENEFSGSITTSFETFASGVSDFGEDNGLTTTLDLTGSIGGRDDLSYRFIASGNSIDSFRGDVNNSEWNVYSSVHWEINDISRLTLGLEVGAQYGDADYGLVALNNDISTVASIDTVYQQSSDYDDDEGQALTAHYQRDLGNGQFNFKWRSNWHTDERRLYENNRVEDDDETLRRRLRDQSNRRDWHSFDAYVSKDAQTGTLEHALTFGLAAEYRVTDFDRSTYGGFDFVDIYDPDVTGSVDGVEGNRRKTSYYSAGLYVQDKVTVTDALTIVGSARVNRTKIDYVCLRGSCNDDNTTNTTDFVGSLGAVYRLNDSWSIFGSVAQSFDPYTAERVDTDGDALDAEKSFQIEAGLKYQLGDTMNVSLSAYRILKDNVSESLGDGAYELVGEVESNGLEFDLQWLPTENWQIKAGYAYNDTVGTEGEFTGMTAANAPAHSASLFTRYNVPKSVHGGTLGFSFGMTYRDDVKTNIDNDSSVTLPSYIVTDIGAHFEKNDWTTSLTVANLLDETYYYAGSGDTRIYAGDPRKIILTISRAF